MKRVLDYVLKRPRCAYLIVILVLLGACGGWLLYANAPVGGDLKPVIVVVPEGATALGAGGRLEAAGLVRSGWGFAVVARLTGAASKIKPGVYEFSRAMSARQMLDKLVRGEVAAVWVTIPEGFTVRQIADRLAARKLVNRDEFLALARSGAKDFRGVLEMPGSGLEGYLFPATYLISFKTSAREVLEEMLKTFRSKAAKPYAAEIGRVAASGNGESNAAALSRIVIVASMIEREAKLDEDRPLISAVIWNRLRLGMKLDIDATVQYGLGGHRPRLFYGDLAADTPYNTYLHAGLPPGPISNPGLASFRAALRPAKAGYLYYVARPDGSHIFSRTLQEHNAAKKRVRDQEAANRGLSGVER